MTESKITTRRGKGRRTTRSYVWLYHAMKHNLERMKEGEGSFYEALQALVTAAFLVESYLNTVGDKLFRDWQTKPAKGRSKAFEPITKKLKLILGYVGEYAQSHGVTLSEVVDVGSDSKYASLVEVTAFRNNMAHAKDETISGEWESPPGSIGMDGLETEWEKLLQDTAKVQTLCVDCVSLVTTLHRMLYEAGRRDIAVHVHPFISAASSIGWEED